MKKCPKCGDNGLYYQRRETFTQEADRCVLCGYLNLKNSMPFSKDAQIATTKYNKENKWTPNSYQPSNNGNQTLQLSEELQLNSEL